MSTETLTVFAADIEDGDVLVGFGTVTSTSRTDNGLIAVHHRSAVSGKAWSTHYPPSEQVTVKRTTPTCDASCIASNRTVHRCGLDRDEHRTHTSEDGTHTWSDPVPARGPVTHVCVHCDAVVERMGDLWVDTLSGDDGGTYDNCPRGIDAPHVV